MKSFTKPSVVWSVLCRVLLPAVTGAIALSVTSCRSPRTMVQGSVCLDTFHLVHRESVSEVTEVLPFPGDSVSVSVPLTTLLTLPEGAVYSHRRGRTRVTLSRCGGSVLATAESDSVSGGVVRSSHHVRDSLMSVSQQSSLHLERRDGSRRKDYLIVLVGAAVAFAFGAGVYYKRVKS